jgi:hypothetical protein
MERISGVILAFLCGAACVAEEDLHDEVRTPSDDARVLDVNAIQTGAEPDVCELLPHCGPCSVACDLEALSAFVPPGTCAAFACVLVDGRRATFHACHQ